MINLFLAVLKILFLTFNSLTEMCLGMNSFVFILDYGSLSILGL